MASKPYVLTGHIEYGDTVTMYGKVADEVYDTLAGINERTTSLVLTDNPNFVILVNPIVVLSRYFRNNGWDSEYTTNTRRMLSKNGLFSVIGRRELFQSVNSRTIRFNANSLHCLQSDGTFKLDIDSPLPPNMVNRMLQSYQWYLRLWSSIGDESPNWLYSGRDPI